MIRAAALAGLVALLLIGAAPAGAATPARGAFAGPVDLGDGRRIHLECRGAGAPVVVLEAGLRSRSDFWKERLDSTPRPTVFPGIARFTRVCIYDRPGTTLGTDQLSRSDPVPMPRTAKDAVADLRALLRAARLPGPYVLAGHSTGGLIVRLFATMYPGQVAGLIEVDALNEFLQGPLSRARSPPTTSSTTGRCRGWRPTPTSSRSSFAPASARCAGRPPHARCATSRWS